MKKIFLLSTLIFCAYSNTPKVPILLKYDLKERESYACKYSEESSSEIDSNNPQGLDKISTDLQIDYQMDVLKIDKNIITTNITLKNLKFFSQNMFPLKKSPFLKNKIEFDTTKIDQIFPEEMDPEEITFTVKSLKEMIGKNFQIIFESNGKIKEINGLEDITHSFPKKYKTLNKMIFFIFSEFSNMKKNQNILPILPKEAKNIWKNTKTIKFLKSDTQYREKNVLKPLHQNSYLINTKGKISDEKILLSNKIIFQGTISGKTILEQGWIKELIYDMDIRSNINIKEEKPIIKTKIRRKISSKKL